MKSKFFTLLALGLTTAAQADTFNVYITGSTAGRSSVNSIITTLLAGETQTKDNATLNSANKANFTNGTFGGHTWNIYCSWSGSATGVGSLVNDSDVAFLNRTDGGIHTPPPPETPDPTYTFNQKADIAFSDVFQSSTVHTSVSLTDTKTIILPFKFFTSEGSPITNISPQQAQLLFRSGVMPLALFTGNPAHEGGRVFATGRDSGSGTRITTMAEVGVGAFSNVFQYIPVADNGQTNEALAGISVSGDGFTVTHNAVAQSGGVKVGQPVRGTGIAAGTKVASVIDTTHFTLTAAGSVTGALSNGAIRIGQNFSTHAPAAEEGNGGATSGGTVAAYVAGSTEGLMDDFGSSPCYYVGYIGTGDNTTAVDNGAVELTYNGVAYSPANVRNGIYTLWGFLHLMTKETLNPGVADLRTQLVNGLNATPGSSGLANDTAMRVTRLADGGNIFNFQY